MNNLNLERAKVGALQDLNRSLTKQLTVFLKDHFSIDKHWKTRRANVLDLGTYSTLALVCRKLLSILGEHISEIHLDLPLNKNFLVKWVLLRNLLIIVANITGSTMFNCYVCDT